LPRRRKDFTHGIEETMISHDRSGRDDQLLTVADIAGHIGAYEQTVRGWIARGELKASKFGSRIRRGDYDEFLRRQLAGAIARRLLSPGANEPDPAA
jgi:hypothetical protein